MNKKGMILILAALSGSVTMMLEFVLQRLLAAQWGSSVEVWGSTISVVLGGLALGYLGGGALVDRYPKRSLLGIILAALSLMLVVLGFLAPPLLSWLGQTIPEVRLGSLIGALTVLLIPSLFLGSVCPIAVRLIYLDRQHVGRSAGEVYAVSTLGSIAGALLSAFYLLSNFKASLIIFAGAAILATLAALIIQRPIFRVAIFIPVVVSFLIAGYQLESEAIPGKVLAEQGSRYQSLYIIEKEDGSRQLVSGHPRNGIQSQVDPKDPNRLILNYVKQMQRWNCLQQNPERIVILGGGAGSLVRAAKLTSPQSKVDVVELDSEVTKLARRWLSLPEGRGINYFAEDGRAFLDRSEKPIDLLIVDAFSRGQVPAHLLSQEFFALAKQRLGGTGILALNVIASPNSRFTASTVAAIRESFAQTEVLRLEEGGEKQNLLILAGPDLTIEEKCLRRVERETGLDRGELDSVKPVIVAPAAPFTDERGPVDAE